MPRLRLRRSDSTRRATDGRRAAGRARLTLAPAPTHAANHTTMGRGVCLTDTAAAPAGAGRGSLPATTDASAGGGGQP